MSRSLFWAVIAVWLVAIAVLAPIGAKLPDVVNDEYEVPAASQTGQVERILRERFPGGDQRIALLVYERDGGLTQKDRMRILADAQAVDRIDEVAQPVPPFTPQSPEGLVSEDESVAFTIVPLVAGEVFRVRDTVEELREVGEAEGGLEVHVTGFPALTADGNTVIEEADFKLLSGTVVLVFVLLLVVYRSPALAIAPLLVVALAYTGATGIIYLLTDRAGLPVDSTASSLLLVLMFGAGTDYCLLLVSRFRSALREHERATDAARAATAETAPAIVASAVTVIAAMLVMLAGVFGVVRTLGPVNAIGIAFVMVASLTLLPALLAVLGRRAFWPRSRLVAFGYEPEEERPGLWTRVGLAVRRRPALWLVLSVAVLGAASFGLLAHDSDLDITGHFRVDTDGTEGYEALVRGFPPGTVNPTTILVENTGDAVAADDVAAVVDRLEGVEGVETIVDTGRRSTDGRVAALTAVFEDNPFGDPALARVDTLREEAAAVDPQLRVLVGGGSGERFDYRAAGARDFRVVAPLVLGVVLLTLIGLLRALVAPLYLLGTVVLSFLGTFGASLLVYRYVFGQDGIDPALPVIIFIFLVALGSDYNIFLMSRVRELADEHGMREGMLRAIGETGPVITSAGLILAGTFGVLLVLPAFPLIDIGFAVALGVLVDTFLVRTICVPAIAWLVGDRSWWPSRAARAAPSASR